MSAAVVAAGARDAERGVTAPRLLSVKRDRDNVVFVDDDRLLTPFLADALGVDEREASRVFRRLCEVYPAAKQRAASMGVPALARLCSDLPGLSRRLVKLEALFPECDVAKMASQSPWLLELSADEVIGPSLEALQRLFPEAGEGGKPGVHRMVQAVPQLLDATFARTRGVGARGKSGRLTRRRCDARAQKPAAGAGGGVRVRAEQVQRRVRPNARQGEQGGPLGKRRREGGVLQEYYGRDARAKRNVKVNFFLTQNVTPSFCLRAPNPNPKMWHLSGFMTAVTK